MYLKHKIYIHFLSMMLFVMSAHAAPSIAEKVRHFFSLGVSQSIFESVNKEIVGTLRAKNIRFFLPNKVELDDVEVLDEHGARVLYGKQVVIKLSLLSLLTKNITITDALVTAPFFRYTVEKKIHNIIRVFESPVPSSSEKSDMRVSIAHVIVKDGSFEMEHDAGVSIVAQSINAEGKFWVEDGPFAIDLSRIAISRGAIDVAGMHLPVSDLKSTKLLISDTQVSTPKITANYEQAKIEGKGTVYIDKESYDIEALLDAPKNTYPQGLSPLPFIAPAVIAKVKMTGPLEDPDFQVHSDVGLTEFNGLLIGNGTIDAKVNSHQVIVDSAALKAGANGKLSAQGSIDIDRDTFSFSSQQSNIKTAELCRFLSLDIKNGGALFAQTSLSGNLPTKKPSLFHLKSKGNLQNGLIETVRLGAQADFDVDLEFTLDGAVLLHRAVVSDAHALRAVAEGRIDTAHKHYMLSYKARLPSLKRYLPLTRSLEAKNVVVDGHLSIRDQSWTATGALKAKHLMFESYSSDALSFDYQLNNEDLIFSPIEAQVYGGSLKGAVTIKDPLNKKELQGELQIDEMLLDQIKNIPINLEGKTHAQVKLRGTIDKPEVDFLVRAQSFVIDKLEVRNTNVKGSFAEGIISISEWRSVDKSGSLNGQDLRFDTKTKKMTGIFHLHNASIAIMLAGYFNDAEGILQGPIYVDGSFDDPQITAPLNAHNIVLYGQKLGSGVIAFSLKKERLLGPVHKEDVVFSIASSLEEAGGESNIRVGWALNEKTLNVHGELGNMLFDANALPIKDLPLGFQGKLSGFFDAQGALNKLNLEAKLHTPEFKFFDAETREPYSTKNHGPAELSLELKKGHLDLNLCATLADMPLSGACIAKPGLKLSLSGPFAFSSYDLNVHSAIDHEHLEDIFPPLKKELAIVSAMLSVDGRFKKQKNKAPTFSAKVQLERLAASLPTVPHIDLSNPIILSLSENSIAFNEQAIFSFSPGNLAISGNASAKSIDLDLQGAIPLVLARFFVPIIQRADGLAMGHIRITGSPAAPILDGTLEPERGALVTFNKYLESLEVKSGAVVFKKTSRYSFTSVLDNLKLALGDGRLSIQGTLDKHYAHKRAPERTIFDVKIEGSNIVIKNGTQFLETDFKLQTIKGEDQESTLGGSIVVTDGSIHQQFDLRNFVAQASESSKNYSFKFLDSVPMKLDLEIAIRQFKASARMLNIDIETNLVGQLRALGPINHPKVSGSLSISEGKIIFPAATFDLYESRIELDETSDRVFDPKISLTSSYELEKDEYPQLSRDTTIQLELKGDLNRLMLDLKPIRGDLKLSQTKIFLFLLMPQSLGGKSSENQMDVIRRGAQNAALAFSGEVFLRPLTNELQELLEGKTNTRIQFGSALEPGGITLRLSWKIGERIEAQGSYMFVSDDYKRPIHERSAFTVDSYPLSDLKLKLLLFDHKPLGPLFFEGSFGANRLAHGYETRSALRLNYRVLAQ